MCLKSRLEKNVAAKGGKKCQKSKRVPDDVSKKELAKELADVVGLAILNAHLLDIDLEDAIDKKWINKEKYHEQFLTLCSKYFQILMILFFKTYFKTLLIDQR